MKSAGAGKGGGMASGGANAEQVKAVQQALKDQGFDPGPIDGVMGGKTKAALKDYQQKEGLKATGQLDAETSAKLGVEGKTSSATSSGTSPAASPTTSGAGPSTKSKADSGAKAGASAKPSDSTKQQK
jgi:peptidoglycan hydrolase-like protein with peptidoglycan-binding domain